MFNSKFKISGLFVPVVFLGFAGCAGGSKSYEREPAAELIGKSVQEVAIDTAEEREPDIRMEKMIVGVQQRGSKSEHLPFPVEKRGRVEVRGCGTLTHTETGRDAANPEDAFYIFKVDCDSVATSRPEKAGGEYFVRINEDKLKKGVKPMIKYWRRLAALKGGRNASPYLCIFAGLEKNLCEGKAHYQTVSTPICNFTANPQLMRGWKKGKCVQ